MVLVFCMLSHDALHLCKFHEKLQDGHGYMMEITVYNVQMVVFVLRFYGPVDPMRSCQVQSIYHFYWVGLVL